MIRYRRGHYIVYLTDRTCVCVVNTLCMLITHATLETRHAQIDAGFRRGFQRGICCSESAICMGVCKYAPHAYVCLADVATVLEQVSFEPVRASSKGNVCTRPPNPFTRMLPIPSHTSVSFAHAHLPPGKLTALASNDLRGNAVGWHVMMVLVFEPPCMPLGPTL